MHSLVEPRKEYLVRPLDSLFVNSLKNEMLECQSIFSKPLIAIVKGIKSKDKFDESKLDSYSLEVIGGNHRREAVSQLHKEGKLDPSIHKYAMVQLFIEMPQQHALRLAQLHNRVDAVRHDLSTSDKIELCRNILVHNFGSKKCAEWRKMCSTIIGENETTLSNVFYVCSEFREKVVNTILDVLDKYGKAELKGQRVCKKVLKNKNSAIQGKINFPYSKLKQWRGDITEAELLNLLEELLTKEKSLAEMESEIIRIKEMRAVQNFLVKFTNSATWQETKRRFPQFTDEDSIQSFRGAVVRGAADDKFKTFIQRAIANEGKREAGFSQVKLLKVDCLVDISSSIISQEHNSNFQGAEIIFTDLPKSWNKEDFTKYVRMMKTLNMQHNVVESRFVVFPTSSPTSLMFEQIDAASRAFATLEMEWDMAYYHNSSCTVKECGGLSKSVLPFLVSRTGKKISGNDMIAVPGEPFVREKDSGLIYKRQKPIQLYSVLLKMFSPDKSLHVVDSCSGAGSCAVACSDAGLKCLILENSLIRARLIEQRLQFNLKDV